MTQEPKYTKAELALREEVTNEWISIATSTGRMTPGEKRIVEQAARDLFRAGGREEPEVIIVRSPYEMAMVGGQLAWEAYCATHKEWDPKDEWCIKECQRRWSNVYQGGNFWAGWCAYQDFSARVAHKYEPKEVENYQKADCWLQLGRHSNFRWINRVHRDFCVISEKPTILKCQDIGGRWEAHSENGPTHAWADDFSMYHWHGTVVPKEAVLDRKWITIQRIKDEKNAETRRALREMYGVSQYLKDSGGKLVDADYEGAKRGAAPRALVKDADGDCWLVGTDGSTSRSYYMPAPQDAKTCKQAHEAMCFFDEARIIQKS